MAEDLGAGRPHNFVLEALWRAGFLVVFVSLLWVLFLVWTRKRVYTVDAEGVHVGKRTLIPWSRITDVYVGDVKQPNAEIPQLVVQLQHKWETRKLPFDPELTNPHLLVQTAERYLYPSLTAAKEHAQ